jgi:hypothetical protein
LTILGGKIVYGAGAFASLDAVPPPPAMPDWSLVRRFGGYGAWADKGGSHAHRQQLDASYDGVAPAAFMGTIMPRRG